MSLPGTAAVPKKVWTPWGWTVIRLGGAMWEMGIESGSSTRAASALNHRAIPMPAIFMNLKSHEDSSIRISQRGTERASE